MQVKPTAPNTWAAYQPYRRVAEIGYWVIGCLFSAMINAATALLDIRRSDLAFDAWEPRCLGVE